MIATGSGVASGTRAPLPQLPQRTSDVWHPQIWHSLRCDV
jgi:hypothetical protein